MGCDIHSFIEVFEAGEWNYYGENFTDGRSYGIFGFLADVRNYSEVPVLSPRKGFPKDICPFTEQQFADGEIHSKSYLTLKELLDFDYDQEFEDVRCTVQASKNCWSGAGKSKPGQGKKTTVREFLGGWFFRELENMKNVGPPDKVRMVFGFDS